VRAAILEPVNDQTEIPEATLVGQAARGDLVAFETLYRTHAGRVHAVCLRLCADGEKALDLTQECFVRAWRALDDFRGESGLGTWLHRIAVNVFLEDRRRRGRHEGHEEAMEDEGTAPGLAQAWPRETGIDLERAIARLPEGARTIFVLHDVEGYRHDEIAASLGLSVGTSKAQLHRARRLLREALA
jgi:RNA polymerase sigma factor (sigma-70 family)